MLVVEQGSVWPRGKCFFSGAVVAATSVGGWYILDQINEAMDYELSHWIFFPLFFGMVLVYPIAMIIGWYKRFPSLALGVWYAFGFGLGWFVTWELLGLLEFSLWAGFAAEEQTIANLILMYSQELVIALAIILPLCMLVWGACRLIRGKVLLQDGSLCENCGYNLTGNVSGVCPECGREVKG